MENNLKEILFREYGIEIKKVEVLPGGWLNKKFIITDKDDNKYVVKIYSSRKVEKMSKNEFSSDYLDHQTKNNLRIENYMYDQGISCEKVLKTKNNDIMTEYGNDRISVVNYLPGSYVSRNDITDKQLYNLGKECAKMHKLFKNIDRSPYTGSYLKLPTIDRLINNYRSKIPENLCNVSIQYIDLLEKQKNNLILLDRNNIISKIPIEVTHGDFADDNILFEGNKPKIVDFELVRVNSHLLDIGRILMSYCFDGKKLDYNKLISFITGYNSVSRINSKDIFLSFITVWINEVDMWIRENYFNKEITKKAKRFQDELIYLTNNLPKMIEYYNSRLKNIVNYCVEEKRDIDKLDNERDEGKGYGRTRY